MEVQSEINESMQERIYNFVKTIESEEYREMSRKVALIHKEQEVLKNFFVKKWMKKKYFVHANIG